MSKHHGIVLAFMAGSIALAACDLQLIVPNLKPSAVPSGKVIKSTPEPETESTDPAVVGADCTKQSPAATPDVASAALGAYANQLVPQGWNNAYRSEAEATAAFDAIRYGEGAANWPCVNKFYAGAARVYYQRAGTRPPANDCTRPNKEAAPSTGGSRHGRYNGQLMPAGWDGMADEFAVTRAIQRLSGDDRACFAKFYPGLAKVYDQLKDKPMPNETYYPPSVPPSVPPIVASPVCPRPPADQPPISGGAGLGRYAGQTLPAGFIQLDNEAQVEAQIRTLTADPEGQACFATYHPGAWTVFRGRTASPQPSVAPTARPTPTPVPTPTAKPSVAPLVIYQLLGKVYSSAGTPIAQANVAMRAPADGTGGALAYDGQTANGQFVVLIAKPGRTLTFTVSAAGFKPRERVVTLPTAPPPDNRWSVNFGGPATAEDPNAPDFALEPQ